MAAVAPAEAVPTSAPLSLESDRPTSVHSANRRHCFAIRRRRRSIESSTICWHGKRTANGGRGTGSISFGMPTQTDMSVMPSSLMPGVTAIT